MTTPNWQPMSTPTAPPKKSLSGWQIFWIIFGGLVVIGMFTGGAASSGSKPASGSGNSYSYTATTLSVWCETHGDDQWSGEMDSTTRRYLNECVPD